MKPTWCVFYDKGKDDFFAVKWDHRITPKTIKGNKVVILGSFKYPNDAIDYAKALASEGRIKL
jgi:hypothetical protein